MRREPENNPSRQIDVADSTEEQLRRAIELTPHQVGRLVDLARLLARQGRMEESDQSFARAEAIAAERNLVALQARPQLLVAALYLPGGDLYADYVRPGSPAPPSPPPRSPRWCGRAPTARSSCRRWPSTTSPWTPWPSG